MDFGYYHGSYYPGHETLGPYADHRAFDQYPYYPTCQPTPLDPTPMLSTQYMTVWDVRNSQRQTPTSPLAVPLIDPMSPRASDDGVQLVSAQYTGFYPVQPRAQPQVSLSCIHLGDVA